MNIFSKVKSKGFLLTISLTLNLGLVLTLAICITAQPHKIDAEDAYQKAYIHASVACFAARDPAVDCKQLRLSKIDYQTIDNSQWIMGFVADNLDNNVRWGGFFILDDHNDLVDSETFVDHCEHIEGLDCQL